jgi:hypothetical protein
MANGETVTAICQSDSRFPHARKVRGWKYEVEGFAASYMRARELQAEAWEDHILALGENEELEAHEKHVRFDIKKWAMSKSAPHLYGDKVTISGDPAAPLQHVVTLEKAIETMTAAELDALEQFCQARIKAQDAEFEELPPQELAARNQRTSKGCGYMCPHPTLIPPPPDMPETSPII